MSPDTLKRYHFVEQVNQFLSWGLPKPNGNPARLLFPALPPGEGVDE